MHRKQAQATTVHDIWTLRNVLIAIAAIGFVFAAAVWHIVGDSTAEAQTLRDEIEGLPQECRGYAAMALRLEILSKAEPLDDESVERVLGPIADLDPQECATINQQMDAITQ